MMAIRYDNTKQCKSLVTEMAEQLPDAGLLEPTLRRLAEHGLCVRFHQYQIDDMVRKWTRRILDAYPQGRIRVDTIGLERAVSTPTPHTSIFATSTSSTRSAPTVPSSSSSVREESETRTLQDSIAAMQETIRIAQRRLDVLQDMSPATSASTAVTRVSTSDISTLYPPRPVIQSTTVSPRQTSRVPVSSPVVSNAPTITRDQAASSATQAPAPSRSPTMPSTSTIPAIVRTESTEQCTRTHVRRRPLNEECSICYDDRYLSDCDPADLVWCRSGCGRTVHKSCFEDWRTQLTITNPSRELQCMICRTPWVEDCDCTDRCTPTHVRRRIVDGECSICREDLKRGENEQSGLTSHVLSWCKAECGRSVHKECFAGWKESCLQSGRMATCTNCRAVWVDGCEC
jgi:hypothetical protein